jgi:hypothetical protein
LKLADIVKRVVVDSRKLTHYALDENSPLGRHKALVFEKILGFTVENYADLLHQLETKSLNAEAVFHSEDKYGKRYTVDILVDGTEGRQAIVRTGWLAPTGTHEAHLVTLYVKRR